MTRANPLKILVSVCFLSLLLMMGLGAPAAIAASEPPACAAETAEPPLVSDTLKSIPSGFYGILKTEDLKTLIADENPLLVDVREPGEFLIGHIPGAVNIPLRSLTDRLDEIPRDRPVVLYCSTGYRTGIGVMALHMLGYDNVKGYPPSYQGWKLDSLS